MNQKPDKHDPLSLFSTNKPARRSNYLNKPNNSRRRLIIIIAIAALLLLIVGSIIVLANRDDKETQSTQNDSKNEQKSEEKSDTNDKAEDVQKTEDKSTTPTTPPASAPAVTPATPAQDAVAIGETLNATYATSTPSANTCNKALSGYSYSITDQQTSTAKVTVTTQSAAGGNTIAVTMTKTGDKWAISGTTCS